MQSNILEAITKTRNRRDPALLRTLRNCCLFRETLYWFENMYCMNWDWTTTFVFNGSLLPFIDAPPITSVRAFSKEHNQQCTRQIKAETLFLHFLIPGLLLPRKLFRKKGLMLQLQMQLRWCNRKYYCLKMWTQCSLMKDRSFIGNFSSSFQSLRCQWYWLLAMLLQCNNHC